MRTRRVVTCGVLLTGLWAAVATAADEGGAPQAGAGGEPAAVAEEAAPAPEASAVEPGKVPQSQIDLFNKREEAKQRRDELLKLRAVTSQE